MPMSVVYTTVNGQILCENRGGVVSHFVSDPLGSVVMVRDNSGNTVYEAEYDPYGNVQSETGTNPSEFGYVGTLGYVKDSAFSLYVRARYLLTNLGRWLTKDPLWPSEPGFVYAGASPTSLSDFLGLKAVSVAPLPGIWPPGCGFEDSCEKARDLCLLLAAGAGGLGIACLGAMAAAFGPCLGACTAGNAIVIGAPLCVACLLFLGVLAICTTAMLLLAIALGLNCLLAYETCKRGRGRPSPTAVAPPSKGKPSRVKPSASPSSKGRPSYAGGGWVPVREH